MIFPNSLAFLASFQTIPKTLNTNILHNSCVVSRRGMHFHPGGGGVPFIESHSPDWNEFLFPFTHVIKSHSFLEAQLKCQLTTTPGSLKTFLFAHGLHVSLCKGTYECRVVDSDHLMTCSWWIHIFVSVLFLLSLNFYLITYLRF